MWPILMLSFILLFRTSSAKDRGSCNDVEIVSREEWKARVGIRGRSMKIPVNQVIIQHTVTAFCKTKPQCARNIQFMQDYDMDHHGWSDIAYNFMVGGDGRIYEGRGWQQTGSHTINYNTNSMCIAFIGNFNIMTPTQKMISAALNLIRCGVRNGYLTPTREIYGHRDVSCTESPGDKLYAEIRGWNNYKGGRLPYYDC